MVSTSAPSLNGSRAREGPLISGDWPEFLTPLIKFDCRDTVAWVSPWLSQSLAVDDCQAWIGAHRNEIGIHIPALLSSKFIPPQSVLGHPVKLGIFIANPLSPPIPLYEYMGRNFRDGSYYIMTAETMVTDRAVGAKENMNASSAAVDFSTQLLQQLNIFPWMFDFSSGGLSITPDHASFLGLPEDPAISSNPLVHMEAIFSDDREALFKAGAAAIDEGKNYDLSYRIWNSTGEPSLVRSVCHRIAAPGSMETRLFGTTIVMPEIATEIEQSFTDGLTGLLNRHVFECDLEACFKRATAMRGFNYGIAIVDVNSMKSINDQYGHVEGDRYLKHIAGLLKDVTAKNVKAYRVGGDEFALIFSGVGERDRSVRQQLELLENAALGTCFPRSISAATSIFGISIGLAFGKNEDISAVMCYSRADAELYKNKRSACVDS